MAYTFIIKTFGCKVNQYEGQLIREGIISMGLKEIDEGFADVCIVNGCAVTNRSYKKAGKALRAMRENCRFLILTGCSASAFKDAPKDWDFDYLVEQREKDSIFNIVARFLELAPSSVPFISFLKGHHRAFVKVQDGCDMMCSYCYIPYLRGADIRIRDKGEIKRELAALFNSGYKEIVFTGISLGRCPFLHELIYIGQEIGFPRIRLSSIEARDITPELLRAMKECAAACRHLHVPIQSGSNTVLARMNRPYTKEKYEGIISMCRNLLPDIAISTDVMVGFPGETEEEFNKTLEFLGCIRPMRLHVFPFSPRPRTAAEQQNEDLGVAALVKKNRANILIKRSKEWAKEFMAAFIETEQDIIIEERSSEVVYGLNPYYVKIKVSGCRKAIGEFCSVKVADLDKNGRLYLIGKAL